MKQEKISPISQWIFDQDIASFVQGKRVRFEIRIKIIVHADDETLTLTYLHISGDEPQSVLGGSYDQHFKDLAELIQNLDKSTTRHMLQQNCRCCRQFVKLEKIRLLQICSDCLERYNAMTKNLKVIKDPSDDVVELRFAGGFLKSYSYMAYDQIKLNDLSAKVITYSSDDTKSAGFMIHSELDEISYQQVIDGETVVLFDLEGVGDVEDLFPFYDFMMMLFIKSKSMDGKSIG